MTQTELDLYRRACRRWGAFGRAAGEHGEVFVSSYARTGGAVGSQTTSASVVSLGAPQEARLSSLIGAVGVPLLVGCRQEEHVQTLDEGLFVRVDHVVHEPLVDAVGQAAGVEAVLEEAMPTMI